MSSFFKYDIPLKELDSVSLAEIIYDFAVDKFPAKQVEKVREAIQVASFLHRGDVRKGSRRTQNTPPYIEHPLRVAVRIFKTFKYEEDFNTLIAAILHDTVEDHAAEFSVFDGVFMSQNVTASGAREEALRFISEHFGQNVAHYVYHVSNPILPATATKRDKLDSYHTHVKNSIKLCLPVALIKFSDFIDNAGSLHYHYKLGDKKIVYFLDRYSPLVPAYREAFTEYARKNQAKYDTMAVLNRLDKVEDQFEKFRTAL